MRILGLMDLHKKPYRRTKYRNRTAQKTDAYMKAFELTKAAKTVKFRTENVENYSNGKR
jgi:hypothetical protein